MKVPDLIPPPVNSGLETESIMMIAWRAEQWLDALAGKYLSRDAKEWGQRMVLRAEACHPLRSFSQLNGGRESQFSTRDHPPIGGCTQWGESPIIQGEHPLLGMLIRF